MQSNENKFPKIQSTNTQARDLSLMNKSPDVTEYIDNAIEQLTELFTARLKHTGDWDENRNDYLSLKDKLKDLR